MLVRRETPPPIMKSMKQIGLRKDKAMSVIQALTSYPSTFCQLLLGVVGRHGVLVNQCELDISVVHWAIQREAPTRLTTTHLLLCCLWLRAAPQPRMRGDVTGMDCQPPCFNMIQRGTVKTRSIFNKILTLCIPKFTRGNEDNVYTERECYFYDTVVTGCMKSSRMTATGAAS